MTDLIGSPSSPATPRNPTPAAGAQPHRNGFRGFTPRALWSRLAAARGPRPDRAPAPSPDTDLGPLLGAFRGAALGSVAILIGTATGAAFSESYRGLYDWAQHHGFGGFWAAAFPLQVDLFIAVGELVLLVAMLDRWSRRERAGAWLVALAGLAVSVAGNVGHSAAHDLQSRGTAAVPPLAAFGALWLGLSVLKRVVKRRRERPAEAPAVAETGAESALAPPAEDHLRGVLDELTGAVLLLARQASEPLPPTAAVPDHSAVLAEILGAVRDLAGRDPGAVPAPVPADAESAALAAMRATMAAGNPLSGRQLETRFGLTRSQATKVREAAGAVPELNGAGAGA